MSLSMPEAYSFGLCVAKTKPMFRFEFESSLCLTGACLGKCSVFVCVNGMTSVVLLEGNNGFDYEFAPTWTLRRAREPSDWTVALLSKNRTTFSIIGQPAARNRRLLLVFFFHEVCLFRACLGKHDSVLRRKGEREDSCSSCKLSHAPVSRRKLRSFVARKYERIAIAIPACRWIS